MIYLPPLNHSKTISADLKETLGISNVENKTHLKAKFYTLNEIFKISNKLLNRIYIIANIYYKSTKHVSFANNNDVWDRAATVEVFMCAHLFSIDKNIIALIFFKSLSAWELLKMTRDILYLMENIGFRSISVISDNNEINRNMFKNYVQTSS